MYYLRVRAGFSKWSYVEFFVRVVIAIQAIYRFIPFINKRVNVNSFARLLVLRVTHYMFEEYFKFIIYLSKIGSNT